MPAVRFDNDGDELQRTTSLPAIAALTVALWVKISVDTNSYACAFSIEKNNANLLYLETNADGTTIGLWSLSSDTGGGWIDITGPNMTVGTWYYLAFTVSGASEVLYWATAGAAALTSASGTAGAATWFTPTMLRMGDSTFSAEWLNGCVSNLKIWTAVLTLAEIEQERQVMRPVRTADLHSWNPMFNGDSVRLEDWSGNGRALTNVGFPADEDGPPVPYGAPSWFPPFAAAGGEPPAGDTGFMTTNTGYWG